MLIKELHNIFLFVHYNCSKVKYKVKKKTNYELLLSIQHSGKNILEFLKQCNYIYYIELY